MPVGGGGGGVVAGASEVAGVEGAATTGGSASGFASAGGVGCACGCGCDSVAAGGVGAGLAASAAGFGAVAALAILVLYSGGSSRKVYSRTSLPVGQVSSTSISMNGSLTAWVLRMRSTVVEPRRSMVKRKSERIAVGSMPACAKACEEASRAVRSSSPDCSETISISALSGWPSAERRVSLPRPAAWATSGSARKSAAITAALVIVLSTLPHPLGFVGSRTKDINIMALRLQIEKFSWFLLLHPGIQKDS